MLSANIDITGLVTWCFTKYPTETLITLFLILFVCLVAIYLGYRLGRHEKKITFDELESLAKIRHEKNCEYENALEKLRVTKSNLENEVLSSHKITEILKIDGRIASLSILMIGAQLVKVGIFKKTLILYAIDCLKRKKDPGLDLWNFFEKCDSYDSLLDNLQSEIRDILTKNEKNDEKIIFKEISSIYDKNKFKIDEMSTNCQDSIQLVFKSAREMGFL